MKECITKQEEHFGFIPKQNFGFIEEINKKVEKLESLMKLMIDSHLEDFNVHEKNIKFLDEKLKNQEQLGYSLKRIKKGAFSLDILKKFACR